MIRFYNSDASGVDITFSAKLEIGGRRKEEEEGSISMKAAKLEIGIRSQESGVRRKEEEGRRKEEEGRSHNKCFYKYEMLPIRKEP
ncbi:hypothetical protein [Microcoleus sp. D2_18a_B4]|uniref:hypothetical protein n=1 Tax=Microcoleus sp. D2_18a_B4 TaxID=3055329 RepID=UPI002FD677BC